jgi:non-ribosomal peptide synthetase component F
LQAILYIVAVVADETLPKKLAAVGEEGELWIGGIGVSKGYINAPDLTAKVFLKNPFDDGAVYRTGDLVKRVNVSSSFRTYLLN